MKVILNKDFPSLGEEGDVVEVKSGYARNYLIPRAIAVYDSKVARAYFKSREALIEKHKEEKRLKTMDLKNRLSDYEVKFTMTVGDNGHIFGSITPVMIQEYLSRDDINIERKKIEVNSKEIKTPGIYSFVVILYGGERQQVKLVLEAEKKENTEVVEKKSRPRKKVSETISKEEETQA